MLNFQEPTANHSYFNNPQERQAVEFSDQSRVCVYTSFDVDTIDPDNVLDGEAFKRTVDGLKEHYCDYIAGKLGLHDWQISVGDSRFMTATIENANFQDESDLIDMETSIFEMLEDAWFAYDFSELEG